MAWANKARAPRPDSNFIVADADYFHTRARLSYRLARQAVDADAARALQIIGHAFERKARAVEADT